MVTKHLLKLANQKTGLSKSLVKPKWIKTTIRSSDTFHYTDHLLKQYRLNTVCNHAACPNMNECWSKGHATFLILGNICTRSCRFCNITTGKPQPIDLNEPNNIAVMVAKLQLSHVVITSVDRDDLKDGGASHFAKVIETVRRYAPRTTIEILTPDFYRKKNSLSIIMDHKPDVFNHNIETVPRLYLSTRPGARYFHSLNLLNEVKKYDPSIFTKSGLMVGLGETKLEVLQVMDDMRCAGVDFITIGQYLQPTAFHISVQEYIHPDLFEEYAHIARSKGFLQVSSSPLTRSSYHADNDFVALKKAKAISAEI